jgi:hypothetical protein
LIRHSIFSSETSSRNIESLAIAVELTSELPHKIAIFKPLVIHELKCCDTSDWSSSEIENSQKSLVLIVQTFLDIGA